MVFSGIFTVLRTQSNIYDGGFMRKQLMVKSCQLFSKISSIEDVRLGSKYTSTVKHQMEYFIKRTFKKYRSLEKADPGLYKKRILCQNSLYWSTLYFKYDNKILVPNLMFFCFCSFFYCLFVLNNSLHFGKFQEADCKHHNLFCPQFFL